MGCAVTTGRGQKCADRFGGDYGLLVVAATVPDDTAAKQVQQILRAHGVRNTSVTIDPQAASHLPSPPITSKPGPHPHPQRILVFPEDSWSSYRLLCRYTS